MSRVAVGVDGGQSSTVCVVVTSSGEVLGHGLTGPSNHITEPGGPERCRAAVHGAVHSALESAGLTISDVGFVLCGMTGAFPATLEAVNKALGTTPHAMVHDSVTAYHGATGGRPGSVVIGGTGSVGYGEDEAGRSVRVGGWGYLMGDEGSAYWIALQAAQAVARAEDGRTPETVLARALPEAVGASDVRGFHTWLYGQDDRSAVARLAGIVDTAAQHGDAIALGILASAGKELGALSVAVLNQLGLTEGGVRASYVGGVFRSAIVRHSFTDHIVGAIPQAAVEPPVLPPVGGAALLALRELDGSVEEDVVLALRERLQAMGIRD